MFIFAHKTLIMIHRFVIAIMLIITGFIANAQTNDLFFQLNEQKDGYGKISLLQDTKLYQMVDVYADANSREGMNGYRVQIFSGSGQNARATMLSISQQFLRNYPDFDNSRIYTEYKAPYFKMCVGDFRSKGEANAFYHKIKSLYPDSYVVKAKIKFPKLADEGKE